VDEILHAVKALLIYP